MKGVPRLVLLGFVVHLVGSVIAIAGMIATGNWIALIWVGTALLWSWNAVGAWKIAEMRKRRLEAMEGYTNLRAHLLDGGLE